MKPVKYTIRTIRKEDLPQMLDIHDDTSWHRGEHSIYTWYQVDHRGFKVAVTDTGEMLGICCAVRQYEGFFFIGYYIVRKKYRGMGIGLKVWNACMEYIGSSNAGLNAVPEMVDKYRGEFPVTHTECLLQEYETQGDIHPENLSDGVPEGTVILPFQESHLPSMFEYDYNMSGYKRHLAIELNCKEKGTKTVVAFKDGSCVGYATVRSSIKNLAHVCPMYADDARAAEAMLRELLLPFPKRGGFYMVTFAAHQAASDLMQKLGCPKSGIMKRLYRNGAISFDIKSVMHKMFAQFDIDFSPF